MDSNKIDDVNDVISHCSYLLKFLSYYRLIFVFQLILIILDTNLNAAILLDGFLEYHKTLCPNKNCPS